MKHSRPVYEKSVFGFHKIRPKQVNPLQNPPCNFIFKNPLSDFCDNFGLVMYKTNLVSGADVAVSAHATIRCVWDRPEEMLKGGVAQI